MVGTPQADVFAYRTLLAALSRGGNEEALGRVAIRVTWEELCQTARRADLAALSAALQSALPLKVGAARGRPANRPDRRLQAIGALRVRGTRAWAGSLLEGLLPFTRLPEREALEVLRVPGVLGPERAR